MFSVSLNIIQRQCHQVFGEPELLRILVDERATLHPDVRGRQVLAKVSEHAPHAAIGSGRALDLDGP